MFDYLYLSNLFHLAKCLPSPFVLLQMAKSYSFYGWVILHCVCAYHIFMHSCTDKHLGCFAVLAAVGNAAMDTGVRVSFWVASFVFVHVHIPRIEQLCCMEAVGFQGGSVGRESACVARDTGETGSIPGLGRSHGERHGNPLQYSCLENLMGKGA